jgi:ADP-glucose pyrophosphorylase
VPALGAARQAGGALRRQVPDHRLHAVQLRQLRYLRHRRRDAVPADLAAPAHRHRRPWDLDRNRGGVQLLQPSLDSVESDWYRGTADAIFRNLVHVRRHRRRSTADLSGDHVYKMDYNILYAFHEANRASVTVAVTEVPAESVSSYGILEPRHRARHRFKEKPRKSTSRLASMGVYLFDRHA